MKPMPIHERLKALVEAEANAKKWAIKGIELAKAGKIKEAQAAERKALFWLAKQKKLRLPSSPP